MDLCKVERASPSDWIGLSNGDNQVLDTNLRRTCTGNLAHSVRCIRTESVSIFLPENPVNVISVRVTPAARNLWPAAGALMVVSKQASAHNTREVDSTRLTRIG